MSTDALVIRPMTRAELDTAIEWAAGEGWNPGLHDADAYYAADPGGFFVAERNGGLVGTVSAVRYSPAYAFMGFFIVKPELRGGLLGPRLAEHAFRHVGEAVVGLDGVLEQAGRYAGIWGFEPAYHNQRYAGVSGGPGAPSPGVAPYTPADFDAVLRYDARCFPASRPAFLERWLAQPEAHVRVLRKGGAVRAYGMLRRAREGYRIGPLFADGPEQADALFDALAGSVPAGTPVFIDVPQANPAAMELVSRRGMTPVFETARMYRGGFPDFDLDKVFGVTTLELG